MAIMFDDISSIMFNFSISDANLSSLLCRHLSELALLYCQRIGDLGLLQVGKGCQFLQALHLVDCSSIGDEAMCGIATGCKNLKKLHIRRCYEVLHLYSCLIFYMKMSFSMCSFFSFENVFLGG